MASKAYVASMTVTELKQELKQRGLSTRGSKKSLRDRLERAFDEEELDDPSSESDSGQLGPAEAGFNFNVPEESFLPADQIREDSPILSPNREKMIISVELSNKETLEVYSPQPPPIHDGEGEGHGREDEGGPLVVAVSLPNDTAALDGVGVTENHTSPPTVATVMVQPETAAEESSSHTTASEPLEVKGTMIEPKTSPSGDQEADTSLPVEAPPAEVSVGDRAERTTAEAAEANQGRGIEGEGGDMEEQKNEVVSAADQLDKQVEQTMVEEQAEEDVASKSPEEVNKPSPHPPEEGTAPVDMELDSSEPLQSLPISKERPEESGPDSKDKEIGGQGEGEGEGEGEAAQIDEGVKRNVEETGQVVEELEKSLNESQDVALPNSATSVGNEDTVQAEGREDADSVQKPEEENSKDVEGPHEGGSEVAGELEASSGERAEVTVIPQEMGQERAGGQTTEAKKSPEEEAEKDDEMTVDMEIDESTSKEVRAIPTGEDQKQQLMETEKEVHEAKEAPPTPPSAAQDDRHPTPEQHIPDGSSLQVLTSSSPHSSTKQGDAIVDNPPVATEAAVPEEVSTESGQIEVAVLVHAEEDDLSVFSTEAAEAQKIASSREKERGKPRDKVRDRDRDRDKNKHRRASASSSAASLSSSKQQSPHVDEGTGSNASSRSSSEAARLSPNEETRHDGEETENRVDPPLKKRRRISAHVSSSATDPPSIQWGGGGERRRRWGSGKQRSTPSTTNISSDVLKDIIPSELEMEEGEREGEGMLEGEGEGPAGEEIHKEGEEMNGEQDNTEKEKDEHQLEWELKVKEREAKQREAERARQELETRHRIEARIRARQESDAKSTKQEEEKEPGKKRSPSPAHNPPSHILHVENMTRPFTLGQLRELLTQDGPMLKDGFWTNNVKSHCIGVYASKEVAAATRRRLHGLKWPSTNPKLLAVDFLSPEQVQKISEGDLVVMEAPPEVETKEEEEEGRGTEVKGDGESGDLVKEEQMEAEEAKSEEGGRKRRRESEREKQEKVEKDKTKETKKDVSDDVSKPVKAATDPQEKTSQATRLLDDLFRKTKATPSVYWLPLSEAEVQQKQLEREAREAEREKRRQERQKAYEEERRKEREREEMAKKERERRIQEERDRRARERVHRRSRDYSRSRSRSRERHRDRGRR